MKIITTSLFILFSMSIAIAQDNRTSILQDLEKRQASPQEINVTATLKSASRLFGTKDDLTTVITIIPSGTVVDILGVDSTYLNVAFEDTTGYIFRRQAQINTEPATVQPAVRPAENITGDKPETQQQQQQQQESRFTYLENKYGTSMAAKLMSGKVWKGMDSEMVLDSWGKPQKINRVISGNIVKEEWIYKSTWLYIENDRLEDWGPIRNQ